MRLDRGYYPPNRIMNVCHIDLLPITGVFMPAFAKRNRPNYWVNTNPLRFLENDLMFIILLADSL